MTTQLLLRVDRRRSVLRTAVEKDGRQRREREWSGVSGRGAHGGVDVSEWRCESSS